MLVCLKALEEENLGRAIGFFPAVKRWMDIHYHVVCSFLKALKLRTHLQVQLSEAHMLLSKVKLLSGLFKEANRNICVSILAESEWPVSKVHKIAGLCVSDR